MIFLSVAWKAQNELKQYPCLELNKHLTSSLKFFSTDSDGEKTKQNNIM